MPRSWAMRRVEALHTPLRILQCRWTTPYTAAVITPYCAATRSYNGVKVHSAAAASLRVQRAMTSLRRKLDPKSQYPAEIIEHLFWQSQAHERQDHEITFDT